MKWEVLMAHSLNENAGQRYASARKQGVKGKELQILRAAVINRKRTEDVTAEDMVAINARIASANQAHQSYYYYR